MEGFPFTISGFVILVLVIISGIWLYNFSKKRK